MPETLLTWQHGSSSSRTPLPFAYFLALNAMGNKLSTPELINKHAKGGDYIALKVMISVDRLQHRLQVQL
jgi:hypothetical protein